MSPFWRVPKSTSLPVTAHLSAVLLLQVYWEDLPFELECLIASFGAGKDMRGVCSSWKKGFERTTTKIAIRGPIWQSYFDLFRAKPALVLPPNSFQKFESLKVLEISHLNLSKITHFQGLARVEEIHLVECFGISPSLIRSLRGLPHLKRLSEFEGLVGDGILALEGLPVTKLNLPHCQDLKAEEIQVLRGLPLESLHLDFSKTGSHGIMYWLSALKGVHVTSIKIAGHDSGWVAGHFMFEHRRDNSE